MKKDNKPVVKTQYDVIHLFANGTTDLIKNNVKSIDNRLYYNSLLIAIAYKNIVFIKNFSNIGAFGNGLDTWKLRYVFDKAKYTIIIVSELKDNLQFNVEKAIAYQLEQVEDKIGNIFRVIDTNSVANIYKDVTIDNEEYNNIIKLFKHKVNFKFLNDKVTKIYATYYQGWNSYTYVHTLNKSIKQIFNNKIFTDNEINIYNSKLFWYENIRNYTGIFNNKGIKTSSLKDKLFIYNDINTRNRILEINKLRKQHEEERLNKLNENAIKSQHIAIIDWMKGGKHIKHIYLPNIILSNGIKLQEDEIITSNNARVPVSHARALYIIFKKCEDTNTDFIANGNTISIGHYKVEYIKKGICDLKEQYYLKAGCHYISSQIINEFININNLDW